MLPEGIERRLILPQPATRRQQLQTGEQHVPAITNAHLTIAPDDYARTTAVRVTCAIAFTPEELATMTQRPGPVHFTLFCWLVGKDDAPGRLAFLSRRDWLYHYQSQPLPQGAPMALEPVTFKATLGHDLLNEDVIGKDEIMAQLLLRGWRDFAGVEVAESSNTVKYDFG
jgi:hypothetical protein